MTGSYHWDRPLPPHLRSFALINHPMFNKGTAFTEAERDALGLHGLLPPHVGTLDQQLDRRIKALRAIASDFQKYAFLRDLEDTNETLFYAMLVKHIEELLPLVYTPTVGEGCQRFSEIWRKPRGIFLSYPNRHRISEILARQHFDDVRVIVVSDGERILGLGDQGAGGMGIPIGKLSLYVACAGIHPMHTLPILLDVGTNNSERLSDPLYLGWRHERVRGEDYDGFVEDFVRAVEKRWPNVLLQWEDFAGENAGRLLTTYRDRLCTFNDDIQGTAAVAAGTLLAAIEVTGIPLKDQRIVLFGAGSAGIGISSLILDAMVAGGLTEEEARRCFYAVDKDGLLVEGMNSIRPAQRRVVRDRADVAHWKRSPEGQFGLYETVSHVKPTTLIGVSGQAGAFTEGVVRAMADGVERPVIFPLSNPTSRSEATPHDLIRWTSGRALVGAGSPFPPVEHEGRIVPFDQTNNSYIFPGVGLGVLAVGAQRVSDGMFMAAARALAAMSPARSGRGGKLLPPVDKLRDVAVGVAKAVANQAILEGLADPATDVAGMIERTVWEPEYRVFA